MFISSPVIFHIPDQILLPHQTPFVGKINLIVCILNPIVTLFMPEQMKHILIPACTMKHYTHKLFVRLKILPSIRNGFSFCINDLYFDSSTERFRSDIERKRKTTPPGFQNGITFKDCSFIIDPAVKDPFDFYLCRCTAVVLNRKRDLCIIIFPIEQFLRFQVGHLKKPRLILPGSCCYLFFFGCIY